MTADGDDGAMILVKKMMIVMTMTVMLVKDAIHHVDNDANDSFAGMTGMMIVMTTTNKDNSHKYDDLMMLMLILTLMLQLMMMLMTLMMI